MAERVVVSSLVIAGFVPRFIDLDAYAINPDEAQFLWFAAAENLGDLFRYEQAYSPHPPANFVMLHYLLEVTSSLFWLRLPSVVGGTLTVWVTQRFVRELFGPTAGISAAFLVAFSPTMIELSRVCRNYAPGFAVLALALLFFARFVRRESWRDYAAFAALAPLAVLWHYGFVAAFAGLDLALVGILLRRRKSVTVWARVVALQIPFALLMALLYFLHVTEMAERLVPMHQSFYEHHLGPSPTTWLMSVVRVCRFLLLEPLSFVLAGICGIALVDLTLRRRFDELMLCVFPIAVAIGLAGASLMPLGPTRHSAYLFPFLFGLASSQVPRLIAGYRTPARSITPESSTRARRRGLRALGSFVSVIGTLAVLLASGQLLASSWQYYMSDAGWHPLEIGSTGRELSRDYRTEDLDRSFALLEEHFVPGDMAMLGSQEILTLRVRLGLSPSLDPSAEEVEAGSLRIAQPGGALRHTANGVDYYWSHQVSLVPTPNSLLRGVNDARRRFGVRPPGRVWLMRSAWQRPPAEVFGQHAAGLAYDEAILRESNGLLLAIPYKELHRVKKQRPNRPRTRLKRNRDRKTQRDARGGVDSNGRQGAADGR